MKDETIYFQIASAKFDCANNIIQIITGDRAFGVTDRIVLAFAKNPNNIMRRMEFCRKLIVDLSCYKPYLRGYLAENTHDSADKNFIRQAIDMIDDVIALVNLFEIDSPQDKK